MPVTLPEQRPALTPANSSVRPRSPRLLRGSSEPRGAAGFAAPDARVRSALSGSPPSPAAAARSGRPKSGASWVVSSGCCRVRSDRSAAIRGETPTGMTTSLAGDPGSTETWPTSASCATTIGSASASSTRSRERLLELLLEVPQLLLVQHQGEDRGLLGMQGVDHDPLADGDPPISSLGAGGRLDQLLDAVGGVAPDHVGHDEDPA